MLHRQSMLRSIGSPWYFEPPPMPKSLTGEGFLYLCRYKLDFAHNKFGLMEISKHELSKPIRLFTYCCNLKICGKYRSCFELNTGHSEFLSLGYAKSG
jgi:hypothetical protein